jgi:hypothetical protein
MWWLELQRESRSIGKGVALRTTTHSTNALPISGLWAGHLHKCPISPTDLHTCYSSTHHLSHDAMAADSHETESVSY